MESIEILEPKTGVVVGTISVNGGPPEISTSNSELRHFFCENIPDILTEVNKVEGTFGYGGALFEKIYSPGQPEYWPSMRIAIGDYLLRDPKTGKVF
jgi:hypothetical protein